MQITAETAKQDFAGLIADRFQFLKLSVSELFALASYLVVAGDFQAKTWIYRLISAHPEASEQDFARVMIWDYDVVRRLGNPKRALDLLTLHRWESLGLLARVEFLQAVGECRLALGELTQAIKFASEALVIAKTGAFVPDFMAYLVTTFVNRKLLAHQVDESVWDALRELEAIQADPMLDPGKVARVTSDLYFSRGRAFAANGKNAMAKLDFAKAFDVGASTRDKVVFALDYLYCCTGDPVWGERYYEFAEFFKANHQHLLPTDITGMQPRYGTVMQILGVS